MEVHEFNGIEEISRDTLGFSILGHYIRGGHCVWGPKRHVRYLKGCNLNNVWNNLD